MLIPLAAAKEPGVVGTKAARLSAALAAGLPVPPGWVLSTALTDRPAALEALRRPLIAAGRALARAGGVTRLAVRSSSPSEDLAGQTAAGLFTSCLDVRPAGLPGAVARVRRSARQPAALALLGARSSGAPPAMAVLIMPMLEAIAGGVLFSDDPAGGRGTMRLEWVAGHPGRLNEGRADPFTLALPRRGPLPDAARGPAPLSAELLAALRQLGLQARQLLGGPADVEWVVTRERLWLTQLRPLQRSTPAPRPPGWRRFFLADRQGRRRRWRWDAEHNPDPLSPLQADLVARVTAAPGNRWEGRVIAGFLYYAEAPSAPGATASRQPRLDPEGALRGLERQLAAVDAAPDLGTTVDRYVELVLRYQRSAAQARGLLGRLRREASERGGELQLPPLRTGAEALLARLRRAARGDGDTARTLARCLADPLLASLSPAWDVAVPTFAEAPAPLEAMLRQARAVQNRRRRATKSRGGLSGATLDLARRAAELLENDDLIFAGAQASVRRQARAAGQAIFDAGNLGHPDDVFFLTVDEILELQRRRGRPARGRSARRRPGSPVAARRRQLEVARQLAPPLLLVDGRPAPEPPATRPGLRGHGVGRGQAVGRARLLRHLDELPPGGAALAGEVVVVPALLAHAVHLLVGVRAVVTDHGGALSHAATLAREAGLLAVVGTRDATRRLRSGQLLAIDADRGTVTPLD